MHPPEGEPTGVWCGARREQRSNMKDEILGSLFSLCDLCDLCDLERSGRFKISGKLTLTEEGEERGSTAKDATQRHTG